ncbi:ATP-binding cassette domain-containing protein [Limnobacter sp.]|uniref:ATP-binding cassette domain-containing protein n=1 Tax=Limnobacter sp. TaxID=2003368 RepID=UPI002582A50F|nr:ATP-binding cassette domain-containing protein [Limnobacter sp.]
MLQDLRIPATEFVSAFEQALNNNGYAFLKSHWELACQQNGDPLKCAQSYLSSCSIPFEIHLNVRRSEAGNLSEHALVELPEGSFTQAGSLSTLQLPDDFTLPRVLILRERSDWVHPKSPNVMGLVEFWKKLANCDWLMQALKASVPTLKPVIWASILINLLALAPPFFSIQVYDRVIPNEAYASLFALLVGVIVCLVFDHLLKHARHRLTEYAATVSDAQCTELISRRLLATTSAQADPAHLLQHLRSFESIRDIITGMFLVTLIDLPFLVLFMAIIAVIHPLFLLISLSVAVITSLLVAYTHRKIATHGQQHIQEFRENQSKWLDVIQNLEGIQLHGIQNPYADVLNKGQLLSRISSNNMREVVFASGQLIYLLQQISWVSTICLGVFLIVNQMLTVGGLIAVSMLTMRCFAPISRLQGQLIQTHAAQAGFEDLDRFLSSTTRPSGQSAPGNLAKFEIRQACVLKPGIEKLHPLEADFLLHHVDMRWQGGDRIGIIGPAGSGKTSLLKMIAGLHPLWTGQYMLNDMEAKFFDGLELGRQIGFAQQPPLLLKATLFENLTLKRPWITEKECWAALEAVGLADWVRRQAQGLSLQIENAGSNLSSGQRQMVSLARAMAGSPSLLLLDEPTVCLDQQSENHLISALRSLPSSTTLLFTTHKLNLLACASRLVLMNNGTAIAQGEKATVLKEAQALQERVHA